jgi:hypothetical protein
MGSLKIHGLWKNANNSIFARALLDNQEMPRIILPEDYSIINGAIEENYPLFSFDVLSKEGFRKQAAFKQHYDEKTGTTTSDEPVYGRR